MLSTSQAARRLELSPAWVRQLAERGELPSEKRVNGREFAEADVDEFAQKRSLPGGRGLISARSTGRVSPQLSGGTA